MAAAVIGFGVFGIVLDPRGEVLDERRQCFREMFDFAGQRAEVELKRRQLKMGWAIARNRRRVPIEAHGGESLANGPQVPDIGSRMVTGDQDQP